MAVTITLGWWLVPTFASIAAIWWAFAFDYRGDYNFAALFTFSVSGLMIAASWAIYFAVMYAVTS
jgi:hypothetical protein